MITLIRWVRLKQLTIKWQLAIMHELDKQLTRYNKYDNVCLKVINKKGKIEYHHVKV